MATPFHENPFMDIAAIISKNLAAWMASTPGLDTLQKVEAKSGIGFGTVRRARNGDGNITVKVVEALAAAFGRKPADLLTPPPEPEPYGKYPTTGAPPVHHTARDELNHPLVTRYATADAATRALVDIALAGPSTPLPPGLSPAMRTLVDMARTAIRAEQTKA